MLLLVVAMALDAVAALVLGSAELESAVVAVECSSWAAANGCRASSQRLAGKPSHTHHLDLN